jgi:hypothetical protein
MLFPVRTATLWSSFPSVEPGDGGAMPSNFYVGNAAPAGALIAFYQATPAKERPWLEIVDANHRVVRTLRGSYVTDEGKKYWVPNVKGIVRVNWDGTEDGPVRWNGTSVQNLGPLSGAEALPGTYTVRLHRDGHVSEQTFALRDDPQSPFTSAQRTQRHVFLAELFADFDAVDRALNTIDAQSKHASPARRAALAALRDRLTANDLHDEDSIAKPDRIREQIGALIGQLGESLQPPFAQHDAALAALRPHVQAALADARRVLGEAP